jgi:hypothetical protein
MLHNMVLDTLNRWEAALRTVYRIKQSYKYMVFNTIRIIFHPFGSVFILIYSYHALGTLCWLDLGVAIIATDPNKSSSPTGSDHNVSCGNSDHHVKARLGRTGKQQDTKAIRRRL